MLIFNLILLLVFLILLVKSAGSAVKYSSITARILLLPEFAVSLFIIAIISVLPEATISIISAIEKEPALGLGTLLGANITDLTLTLGIVALFSSKGLKVKNKVLGRNLFCIIPLLSLPLILGFDGTFTRLDGIILITVGVLLQVKIFLNSMNEKKKIKKPKKENHILKNIIFLIISLVVLIASALFTVRFATDIAYELGIPTVIIGVTIFALGSCLPELTFSIKAVKQKDYELALGDILGTVITDATIILGIVTVISPFSYNPFNIRLLGGAVLLASIFAIRFMRTDKTISKKEGLVLILGYILFLIAEFMLNKVI